jgi:hypothetical protein
MKNAKSIALLAVLLIVLLFLGGLAWWAFDAWRHQGNAENAVLDLTATEVHSQADLDAAADTVKDAFSDFSGCTLNRLWYDQDTVRSMEQEQADSWGASAEDVMVLLGDVTSTDRTSGKVWYQANTHYADYYFILVRVNGDWSLTSRGTLTPTASVITTPTPEP